MWHTITCLFYVWHYTQTLNYVLFLKFVWINGEFQAILHKFVVHLSFIYLEVTQGLCVEVIQNNRVTFGIILPWSLRNFALDYKIFWELEFVGTKG